MTSSTSRAPSVIVVTGPSGAGKGTLIREVLSRVSGAAAAVSATTRDRRPGEQDGREYHFLGLAEFLDLIERGEFLEQVTYVSGHRYGTLRSELDRLRSEGRVPLLELETEGALRVKREVPGAVTIFISARVEELERRLRERATESTGEIGERIALARHQLEQADEFDYIVENDELDRAVEELTELVRGLLSGVGTMARP
ncbi:MAG: guanylate kinase [Acidobacteriota bacterium]|nr:guanylate kinase [Acidobacteriota bacterium]MDE3191752.1 guanylate kinase [Acidobacteriota bacterium]